MIYLYDEAIAADLSNCIDPDSGANSHVKIMGTEGILPLIAQMQEDKISFPLLCLFRDRCNVNTALTNFTAIKKGVSRVVDPDTHMIYNEKILPMDLSYVLTVLATNTVDLDEIVRELIFHYSNKYYLTLDRLPYESHRKLQFGVVANFDKLERSSGALEYIQSGTLYEARIPLTCEGAVMLSYTPHHLQIMESDVEIVDSTTLNNQ